MAVNWDDLKIALAIGRAGSLTRAAQMLGIDQSTAGRRLTALEADLGTSLFTRQRTGFVPTEAGEAAISRAIEVELRVTRLEEELTEANARPVGAVRLVGSPWVLERLARFALAPFLAAHPQLDLRTVAHLPKSVMPGTATLSMWFEEPPRDIEFAIKLGEVPHALYAPRDRDPDRLDWVSVLDEDAPRTAPVRVMERHRKRGERLRLTATDPSILLSAIRAGVGKGLLPLCMAEGAEDIVRLRDGPPELMRALHLHLHPDTVQTLRVQTTVRWLRESFAPVFAGGPELSRGPDSR